MQCRLRSVDWLLYEPAGLLGKAAAGDHAAAEAPRPARPALSAQDQIQPESALCAATECGTNNIDEQGAEGGAKIETRLA